MQAAVPQSWELLSVMRGEGTDIKLNFDTGDTVAKIRLDSEESDAIGDLVVLSDANFHFEHYGILLQRMRGMEECRL